MEGKSEQKWGYEKFRNENFVNMKNFKIETKNDMKYFKIIYSNIKFKYTHKYFESSEYVSQNTMRICISKYMWDVKNQKTKIEKNIDNDDWWGFIKIKSKVELVW